MSSPRSQSEGKEAFEKLSQSEDQLRKVIDTIPTLDGPLGQTAPLNSLFGAGWTLLA